MNNPTVAEMSDFHDEDRLEQLLDLLVDDELTEPRERALLAQLDSIDDGWRRLSLAFLERRAWVRCAGVAATEAVDRSAIERDTKRLAQPLQTAKKPDATLAATLWWVAVAAVCAFLLGRWTDARLSTDGADSDRVANTTKGDSQRRPGRNSKEAPMGSPSRESDEGARRIVDGGSSPGQFPGATMLVATGDQSGFELPVVEYGGSHQWARQPLPIPRRVEQAIHRLGGQIDREYFFAPAEMEDGRHVVVPVEQLHIRPANHRTVY